MPRKKIDENLKKIKGKRLRELRELRGFTQKDVARLLRYEETITISQHENGVIDIDRKLAEDYSKIYGASVSYILGEDSIPFSEIIDKRFEDDSPLRKSDSFIIKMLESMGFKLSFFYVPNYNQEFIYHHSDTWGDTKTPKEFETTFDCIEDFSFVEPKCTLVQKYGNEKENIKEEESRSVITINKVFFNDSLLSFGEFAYMMIELQNYIFEYANNIPQKQSNLKEYLEGMDSLANEQIIKDNITITMMNRQKFGDRVLPNKENDEAINEYYILKKEKEDKKDKRILKEYNKLKEQGEDEEAMFLYNNYLEEKYFVLNKVAILFQRYQNRDEAIRVFNDFFDE